MGLLGFWFGFDQPVDRRAYLQHGLMLGAVKVLVDVTLVRLETGAWALPAHALDVSHLFTGPITASGPGWLAVLVLAWGVPFLWIGMSMSARRAVDAGLWPWLGLLFFLPVVNWLLIALLSVLPGRARATPGYPATPVASRGLRRSMIAFGIAVVLAMGMVQLQVSAGAYDCMLFLGTPFAIGAVMGFMADPDRTMASILGRVAAAITAVFVILLFAAMEGMICLVMALPLVVVPALLGALFGRFLALSSRPGPATVGALVLLLPALAWIEHQLVAPVEHEVLSTVDIAAPPDVVWRNVVAFGELPEPPPLLFRLGVAYPRRARIAGEGVGAERRCEFSTGPFVEPITCWDPPARLSFDVRSQPPTMTELSPYADLAPRHLHGFFQATRGEFRLEALADGGTRLHGSTWYRMDIHPQAYWHILADVVVHWIHLRVMEHVRDLAEG